MSVEIPDVIDFVSIESGDLYQKYRTPTVGIRIYCVSWGANVGVGHISKIK